MIRFYDEELLAPRPTPQLENHPLLAVRDCIFIIFAATLRIECRSSIRNLRTRHAVVIGNHLSLTIVIIVLNVHAPSGEKNDDSKGSFDEELERVQAGIYLLSLIKFPKYHTKAQDREGWRALVNAVMNLGVPYNAGNLTS
jgi:1-acyl-sn-glycerol-3-phosphate acyltransferase